MTFLRKDSAYHFLVGIAVGVLALLVFTPLFWGGKGSFPPGILGGSAAALDLPEAGPVASPFPGSLRVEKPKVRGIHVTSWVTGSDKLFAQLVDLIDRTELNAAVIDLKESDGRVAYEADISLARDTGAVERRIRDLDAVVRTLKEHEIYKIARIVVFKDTYMALHRPEMALLSRAKGEVWRDFKGDAFTNPYLQAVWDYNLRLAEDAARRGFDEIQFDYIRFPSDGVLTDIRYPAGHTEEEAKKIIVRFVREARVRLAPYRVALSVDVFGLTTVRDDVGIGQDFRALSREADAISPMIYPSHYWKGSYGFQNPNGAPYEIVGRALKDAIRKAGEPDLPAETVRKKIRPWLQDFTLGPPAYSAREVRRQIQAAYDNGIEEWLLWNPMVRYTRSALLPEGPQVAGLLSEGKSDGNGGNPDGPETPSPCPPDCL